MEIILSKIDNSRLDVDLEKEATFGKPNDVKSNLESNCIFNKDK